ncbi:MAG: nuclear transport factor 2 family protein [Bacteroidota bacterium]
MKGNPSDQTITRFYLDRYAAKDLASVTVMFAEGIILRDWKIRVVGKELAVQETKKNFESAESIATEVFSTYENLDTVATELIITVADSEIIHIVDVITVNAEGQISYIQAYLGRGDD